MEPGEDEFYWFSVPRLQIEQEMDVVTSLFIVCRYDNTTGIFTVLPGGDGFYYFSTFLLGDSGELSLFEIEINAETLCTVRLEQEQSITDYPQSSCSAATYAAEGKSLAFSILAPEILQKGFNKINLF